jgi:hypothetical protein
VSVMRSTTQRVWEQAISATAPCHDGFYASVNAGLGRAACSQHTSKERPAQTVTGTPPNSTGESLPTQHATEALSCDAAQPEHHHTPTPSCSVPRDGGPG